MTSRLLDDCLKAGGERLLLRNFFHHGDEKRQEQRHSLAENETVTVSIWETGRVHDSEAVLVDVSLNGLGLKMKEMVSAGSQIEVRWRKFMFFGHIRYCRETLDGLRAGVTIDYVRLPGHQGVLCDWTECLDELLATGTIHKGSAAESVGGRGEK